MKAFVRTNSLNQEVILSDVHIPLIRSEEVLVKVKAFGVGIHDRYFIPGELGFPGVAAFPYVIGSEGAGTITKLGDEVRGFSVGDRVIFSTTLQTQGGSWSEYAAAKQTSLIALPRLMTFEQGAALPIAGKAALECIRAINGTEGG